MKTPPTKLIFGLRAAKISEHLAYLQWFKKHIPHRRLRRPAQLHPECGNFQTLTTGELSLIYHPKSGILIGLPTSTGHMRLFFPHLLEGIPDLAGRLRRYQQEGILARNLHGPEHFRERALWTAALHYQVPNKPTSR